MQTFKSHFTKHKWHNHTLLFLNNNTLFGDLKILHMTFALDTLAPPPVIIMSVVRVIGVITIGVSYRRPGPHLPRSIFRTGSVVAHATVWGSFKDITAGIRESLCRARVAENRPLLHTHVTTRYRTLKRNN